MGSAPKRVWISEVHYLVVTHVTLLGANCQRKLCTNLFSVYCHAKCTHHKHRPNQALHEILPLEENHGGGGGGSPD